MVQSSGRQEVRGIRNSCFGGGRTETAEPLWRLRRSRLGVRKQRFRHRFAPARPSCLSHNSRDQPASRQEPARLPLDCPEPVAASDRSGPVGLEEARRDRSLSARSGIGLPHFRSGFAAVSQRRSFVHRSKTRRAPRRRAVLKLLRSRRDPAPCRLNSRIVAPKLKSNDYPSHQTRWWSIPRWIDRSRGPFPSSTIRGSQCPWELPDPDQ